MLLRLLHGLGEVLYRIPQRRQLGAHYLLAVLSVMPLQASSWSNQLASNCESESLWSRRFTLRLRQRVDHHHAAIVPIYDAQETRARAALGSAACLIRGGHYGQRSSEPHLKAEHMAAPTKLAA
jgi:hypothetical protein